VKAGRTFEELRGAGSAWCTSLAYWIGPYGGRIDTEAIADVGGVMSLQYDFEEQADRLGAALPEDQDWTRDFAPVAPVQLASAWSPIPCAVELLGEPRVETLNDDTGIRMGVAAWDAAQTSAITSTARRSSGADESMFIGLLTVSMTRAKEHGRGLLLAAQPGWSYEHVHIVSARTARLMSRAGFVVTTRRPSETR
jgi:hypothetical protein